MQFKLTGTAVSKARPRFHNGKALLPKKYRDGKAQAIHELYMQRRNFDETIKPSEVHIIFLGKHNRKCDGDNALGFVLDCLVQVGFLKDDSFMHIIKMSVELRYSTDKPCTLIELI